MGLLLFALVVSATTVVAAEKETTEELEKEPIKETEKEIITVPLRAVVKFTGGQFFVTNENKFDWRKARLRVNPKLLTDEEGLIVGSEGGYLLKIEMRLEAGCTYLVGCMQFCKADGTMFNPWKDKPLTFTIWCDVFGERRGFWYGELEYK